MIVNGLLSIGAAGISSTCCSSSGAGGGNLGRMLPPDCVGRLVLQDERSVSAVDMG
jgi:hypothetical protein